MGINSGMTIVQTTKLKSEIVGNLYFYVLINKNSVMNAFFLFFSQCFYVALLCVNVSAGITGTNKTCCEHINGSKAPWKI